MERRIAFDDFGLYNAVYMFVNYGTASYPAHQDYHSMIIEPPFHCMVLGLLIRVGIPVHYAESIPPFLLISLGILLILRSKFQEAIKVGLLFGMIAGSLLPWIAVFGGFGPGPGVTRPDLHVAFAWFVGLVALESGRLADWDPRRLFLGSLLLTWASALHYPAVVAWTGVLVYMSWVLKARGWRRGIRPIAGLVLGGLLVGIPYVLLWLVPNWSRIISFVTSTAPLGGITVSVSTHLKAYAGMFSFMRNEAVMKVLFCPLALGVPVVLLSTAALSWWRETRGIAFASLPNLLFLLLVVQRKSTNAGYYIPELMLYTAAFATFFIMAFSSLFRRIRACRRYQHLVLPTVTTLLILVLLVGMPWLHAAEMSSQPRADELAIARAAGKRMLGPNALVGAQIGRTYIYGEAYWYMVDPYVLWNKIDGLNLTYFFAKSDAIGVDHFMSYATFNEFNGSISSWYADGVLSIRGFYFSSRHQSTLSYMLLTTPRPDRIEGYALLGNWTVMHFRERKDGEYVFAAVVGDASSCNSVAAYTASFRDSYLLPPKDQMRAQRQLITFISKTDRYLIDRRDISSRCTIRDEIRLHMELLDYQELLATLTNDRPIQFYDSLEGALDARDASGRHDATTTFRDSFNSDALLARPSNWLVQEGLNTKIVVVDCTQYGEPRKCVRISDNSEDAYAQMSTKRRFEKVSTIEFLILSAQTDKPLNFYGTTARGTIAAHLALRENGMMSFYDGSSWHDFMAYGPNKWYNITLSGLTSNTYDIYVDDILLVHSANMVGSEPIVEGLTFQTYPTVSGGVWYIGSVKIVRGIQGPAIGTSPPLGYLVLASILESMTIGASLFSLFSPRIRTVRRHFS